MSYLKAVTILLWAVLLVSALSLVGRNLSSMPVLGADQTPSALNSSSKQPTSDAKVMVQLRAWGEKVRKYYKSEELERQEQAAAEAAERRKSAALDSYAKTRQFVQNEMAKACQKNGDPSTDFAAVRSAIDKRQRELAVANRAFKEANNAHLHFMEVRNEMFKLLEMRHQARLRFVEEVAAHAGQSSTRSSQTLLATLVYEQQYVDELVKRQTANKQLAVLVAKLAQARSQFESAIKARVAKPVSVYDRKEKIEKRLEMALAKPVNEQVVREIESLRKEWQELLKEERVSEQQDVLYWESENRLETAETECVKALENVIRASN